MNILFFHNFRNLENTSNINYKKISKNQIQSQKVLLHSTLFLIFPSFLIHSSGLQPRFSQHIFLCAFLTCKNLFFSYKVTVTYHINARAMKNFSVINTEGERLLRESDTSSLEKFLNRFDQDIIESDDSRTPEELRGYFSKIIGDTIAPRETKERAVSQVNGFIR